MKNTDWSLNLQQQSSEAGRYNTLEKFENAKVLGVYFCLAKDGESLGVDGEPLSLINIYEPTRLLSI